MVLTSSLAANNLDVQTVLNWFGVAILVAAVAVLVLMLGIFVGGVSSNLLATLGNRRREWRKMEQAKSGCGVYYI